MKGQEECDSFFGSSEESGDEEDSSSQDFVGEYENTEEVDIMKKTFKTQKEVQDYLESFGIPREWYWIKEVKDTKGETTCYVPQMTLVGGMPRRKKTGKGKFKGKMKGKKMRMGRPRLQVGCPDNHFQKLRFPILKLINSVASGTSSVRFVTNGVWDVDPVLGSTNTPFFSEWTAMYSYYRVVSFTIEIHLTNNEAVPVEFELVHSNTDPGTTGLNFLSYSNNSYNKITSLAASTAQPSKTMRSTLSPRRLVGDRAVFTEQNFWGSSSSNPVDQTYVGLAAQINSGNLTNGVYVTGYLEFHVEFFDRKNLQVTYYSPQPYSPQQVLQAQMRVDQAEKFERKVDPSDKKVIDDMVEWRKKILDSPQEKEIRRRLSPYARTGE